MLDFSNADLLGCNITTNLIGDNFRLGTRRALSVQGNLLDLSNSDGVVGILSALSGIKNQSNDYEPVMLRGVNFGRGQIQNLSFSEGNDVKRKRYTCDLIIYETGNLFNLGGQNYSGLNFNQPEFPPALIDDFSEDFTYSKGNDGIYNYTHALSLKYTSGAALYTNGNPLGMAKQMAQMLINSNPVFGFINQFSAIGGKRTYQETQDVISNRYSVTENFQALPPSGNRYYANTFTNSLNVDENGIINVSENGKIQCLNSGIYGSYFDGALNGLNVEIGNAKFRCRDMFAAYVTGNDFFPLNTGTFLSLNKSLNQFSDSVDYTINYSNDPKINQNFAWEYTSEIQKQSKGCYYDVSERGKLIGYTNCDNPSGKYMAALSAYNSIKTNTSGRLNTAFSGFLSPGSLFLVENSLSQSVFNGTIDYSLKFSNNKSYAQYNNKLRKVSYIISDNYPVDLINKFNIPGYNEIVQSTNIQTVGDRSIDITIQGKRESQLNDYLTVASGVINANIPNYDTVFLTNVNYSLKPFQNDFNISANWNFIQ